MDKAFYMSSMIKRSAKGPLFVNMILSELLKERLNNGLQDNIYYWGDKTGNEVDILVDNAGKLTVIELKAGETISQDFSKRLNYFFLTK
ncbi:MAG: DUF4143 domain-containing protein [Chitinophagaceae bacterium]